MRVVLTLALHEHNAGEDAAEHEDAAPEGTKQLSSNKQHAGVSQHSWMRDSRTEWNAHTHTHTHMYTCVRSVVLVAANQHTRVWG